VRVDLSEQDPDEVLSAHLTREQWLGVLSAMTSAMADTQRMANRIAPDTFHGAHARAALQECWEQWQAITVDVAKQVIPEFTAQMEAEKQQAQDARNALLDILFRKDKDDA
jgi:hypothetical protein